MTDVIDEEQSVKWNREEVTRLRKAFENRVDELNKYKNLIFNEFENGIIKILAKDNHISVAENKKIWRYVFEERHSNGIRTIIAYYYDFIDVYIDLLKIREEQK